MSGKVILNWIFESKSWILFCLNICSQKILQFDEKKLKKLLFILQSTVASNRGLNSTETLLKYLEKIDQPEPEVKEEEEENFDDITLFDVTKDESSITLQQAPNMSINLDDDFDKL